MKYARRLQRLLELQIRLDSLREQSGKKAVVADMNAKNGIPHSRHAGRIADMDRESLRENESIPSRGGSDEVKSVISQQEKAKSAPLEEPKLDRLKWALVYFCPSFP